uniref:EGF-like domain-containing protein n=1 Tax=Anopheles epiroticus TaxID=199890 RepID=A0A182PKB2_9DIPT
MSNGVCKPSCSHCQNGTCVAPNQCICNKGYELNNAGTCVRKCNGVCLNGICSDTGECVCAEGYFSSPAITDFDGLANATLCIPNCDKPCQNGRCVGRNRCQCREGFQPSGDPVQCEPICMNDCSNGKCTAPNICQCNEGYRYEVDRCVPHANAGTSSPACRRRGRGDV